MNPRGPQDAIRPPPDWASWFRSDDLDEVREVISRIDVEHSRVARRSGPLGFQSARISSEACSVAWGRVALPLTIRGTLPNPVLHLKIPAATGYRIGRREILAGPGDAVFVAAGLEFTRHAQPGSMLAIGPDEACLLEEIAARGAGKSGRLMLTTRQLTIGLAALARLAAALDDFVRDKFPGRDALAGRHSEAALLGAVADILIEGAAIIPTRAATNARVADVENWIDANLDRPVTAGQLCRVAGVSQRGLEKAFELRRGMSPMRFLTERRLAAAHRMLVRAGPGGDVTTIASSVGFTHMGRFASEYRQAFGEPPSASLRRARGGRSEAER
jgi:AraC-like DNA-binding protein